MSHQPDNIFAGTQVVSLVAVRGTNNSLVHPRGAVGVVTRTPAGDQDPFLVRFPDGFEASFTREKLEVLKHFKDRLGEVGRDTPCAPDSADGSQGTACPTFDLESFIIYRCVVGSRPYGLDNDDSDTDRRGTRSPCSHRSRPPTCKVAVRKHLFGALVGAGPACFEDNATQNRGNTSQDLGSSLPWAEVDAWRKQLHRDFECALAETKLPERPDYEAANRFLIKARREMAR